MYATNGMYGTHMSVLDIWIWTRGNVPEFGLIDEDVSLQGGGIVTS
jgi:hypothetical protein